MFARGWGSGWGLVLGMLIQRYKFIIQADVENEASLLVAARGCWREMVASRQKTAGRRNKHRLSLYNNTLNMLSILFDS